MLSFLVKNVLEALGENLVSHPFSDGDMEKIIDLFSTDSRQVEGEKSCFIALKGIRADDEMMNAHNFVASAVDKGAYAIVSEDVADVDKSKLIMVKDTFVVFGQVGNLHRRQFKGKVIGITGSSGKTSTKDTLRYVLEKFGKTYATPKNYNSQLGVPQCLIDITKEDYDYAIIEMGMSAKGELLKLTNYTQPDVAVAINVFPMHLEYFDSIEAIALEKASVFDGLVDGGIAVYNADSNCSNILEQKAEEHKCLGYGLYGKELNMMESSGKEVNVIVDGNEEFKYKIPEDSFAFRYNSLSSACICMALGLPLDKIFPMYENMTASDGRGRIKEYNIDNKKIRVIDESYAGGHSVAVNIGLKRLGAFENKGRKIAIIGNMAELGFMAKEEHQKVGQFLDTLGLDKIVLIGKPTVDVLSELSPENKSKTTHYETVEEILPLLREGLEDGDLFFIKGAHYSSQVWQITSLLRNLNES